MCLMGFGVMQPSEVVINSGISAASFHLAGGKSSTRCRVGSLS